MPLHHQDRTAAETPIILTTDESDAPIRTTLGRFMADNEFGPEWLAEIEAALSERGEYVGGGGSTPDWAIRLAAPEPTWPVSGPIHASYFERLSAEQRAMCDADPELRTRYENAIRDRINAQQPTGVSWSAGASVNAPILPRAVFGKVEFDLSLERSPSPSPAERKAA